MLGRFREFLGWEQLCFYCFEHFELRKRIRLPGRMFRCPGV